MKRTDMMNLYEITVRDAKGAEVSLSEFKGKVLLVVNTATACGFTPQYEELQRLYEAYRGRGFEILDFPCNQFGNQAPGTEEEIVSFCRLNYHVSFRQFAKVEVNGANESPLFTYLKAQQGFAGFPAGHPLTEIVTQAAGQMDPDFRNNSRIKWNFTKFPADGEGNVVRRYEPMASLAEVEADLVRLLEGGK